MKLKLFTGYTILRYVFRRLVRSACDLFFRVARAMPRSVFVLVTGYLVDRGKNSVSCMLVTRAINARVTTGKKGLERLGKAKSGCARAICCTPKGILHNDFF